MHLAINRIIEMHDKFKVPQSSIDDYGLVTFRTTAMIEEILEFQRAALAKDRVAALDAIIDLMVFAIGTAEVFALSHALDEGFHRVMDANMRKELAGEAGRSKRAYAADLIKPEGWTPARLEDLL